MRNMLPQPPRSGPLERIVREQHVTRNGKEPAKQEKSLPNEAVRQWPAWNQRKPRQRPSRLECFARTRAPVRAKARNAREQENPTAHDEPAKQASQGENEE